MAKKQTRRSISVRGSTYYRLREYCDGAGVSMSDFIEQRIAEHLKSAGFQGSGVIPPRPAKPARPNLQPIPAAAGPAAAERPAQRFSERFVERLAERNAARAAEKAAPAPIPAQSTIVKKPQPVAALRASVPPAPARPAPVAVAAAVGRPAPTPAREVLKDRFGGKQESGDGKDYRSIRF